jgi:hypothetical protein
MPGVGMPSQHIDYFYDAAHDCFFIYSDAGQYWSLVLGPSPHYTLIPVDPLPDRQRFDFTMTFDVTRSRPLIFGGQSSQEPITNNDLFTVQEVAPTPSLEVETSPPIANMVGWYPYRHCYPVGSTVEITAQQNYGLQFTGWSGDASGTENPLTITMSTSRHIVANYAAYLLTVSSTPSDLGHTVRSPDWPAYSPGSTVQVSAFPHSPAHFVGWSGDASGNANPLTVTMDRSRTIVANFSTSNVASGTEEPILESAITQVRPNPSLGRTSIELAVARVGRVTLRVVDVAGRQVATLVDEVREPGRYTLAWNGAGGGTRVNPGVYFLRLTTADRSMVKRMVMVR